MSVRLRSPLPPPTFAAAACAAACVAVFSGGGFAAGAWGAAPTGVALASVDATPIDWIAGAGATQRTVKLSYSSTSGVTERIQLDVAPALLPDGSAIYQLVPGGSSTSVGGTTFESVRKSGAALGCARASGLRPQGMNLTELRVVASVPAAGGFTVELPLEFSAEASPAWAGLSFTPRISIGLIEGTSRAASTTSPVAVAGGPVLGLVPLPGTMPTLTLRRLKDGRVEARGKTVPRAPRQPVAVRTVDRRDRQHLVARARTDAAGRFLIRFRLREARARDSLARIVLRRVPGRLASASTCPRRIPAAGS